VLLPARGGLAAAMASLGAGITALTAAAMQGADADPALPAGLGAFIGAARRLAAAPSIVLLASRSHAAPADAAIAWAEVGAGFNLDALAEAARRMPAGGPYGDRARAALLADLRATQARLAAARLAGGAAEGSEAQQKLVREAAVQADFAAVTVAARALATL
jgi:glutamate dehydrogenase